MNRENFDMFRVEPYYDPSDTSPNECITRRLQEEALNSSIRANSAQSPQTPQTPMNQRVSSMGGNTMGTNTGRTPAEQFAKSIKRDIKDFEELKKESL